MLSSTPSFEFRLAWGLASYLAEHNLLDWDDNEQGEPYTAETECPTYIGPEMPAGPDRIAVITPGTQTFVRATVTTMMQVRLRGAADEPADVVAGHAQAIRDALYPNGFPLAHVSLGDVRVGAVIPSGSTLPIEADSARRAGYIMNFAIRARRV